MGKCGWEGEIAQIVHLAVVQGPKVFTARYATERASVNHPNGRLETVAVFSGTDIYYTRPIVRQLGRKTCRQNIKYAPFIRCQKQKDGYSVWWVRGLIDSY